MYISVVKIKLAGETKTRAEKDVYPLNDFEFNFIIRPELPPMTFSMYKKRENKAKLEPIEENIILLSMDTCISMSGTYEEPKRTDLPCVRPAGQGNQMHLVGHS